MVPAGVILTLDYYLKSPTQTINPWFAKMLDSYEDLFDAADRGDFKRCLALLDMGLASSATDTVGHTPLTCAAEKGNTATCMELVKVSLESRGISH